ncbi:MAG TPA: hypothetical protein VHM65_01765, partial [Candidatus Lustribacter sp.]|nr:hypothetical protein [Candidatus Lustribacter sp.]
VRAGAVVAALFLREFAGSRHWAHLDIAGPGRAEADSGLTVTGPTGFGARLLLDYLAGLDPAAKRPPLTASPRRAGRRRREAAR